MLTTMKSFESQKIKSLTELKNFCFGIYVLCLLTFREKKFIHIVCTFLPI